MKEKIKNNIKYIIVFAAIVSIVIVLLAIVIKKVDSKDNRFSLDKIYDVLPEEVRSLYSNAVEVSCQGDLYFDVKLDAGENNVTSLNKNELLNYMFSNLEKNELLSSKLTIGKIKETGDKLFYGDASLLEGINNYQYGDYVYNVVDNKLKRESSICNSAHKYVSYLYGFHWTDEELLIDVLIGELKDDTLYDLSGNKRGVYNGEIPKLSELLFDAPYYRYHYVKENNILKLKSVELMSTD